MTRVFVRFSRVKNTFTEFIKIIKITERRVREQLDRRRKQPNIFVNLFFSIFSIETKLSLYRVPNNF